MVIPDVTLSVGDLHFALQRSARRKTMEITVDRQGDLVLKAPPDVGEAKLRSFVEEKRFWVYTKLAEKERLYRATERKEFVDGEGFLYLGRSYRLDAEGLAVADTTLEPMDGTPQADLLAR